MALKFLNDGYFAGKVGIGTETPAARLHVNPTTPNEIAIAINGTQNYSAGQFHRIAAGDSNSINRLAIGFGYDNPTDWAIRYSSYGRHEFYTGNDWGNAANTEKMVITSAGNVGIGTGSPDGNLEIVTSAIVSGASDTVNNVLIGLQAANRPTIILDTADTTYTNRSWNITNVGSAGKLFIGRNGLDVMVMDNSGKVGIGTDSPQRKLTIYESSGNAVLQLANNTSGVGASDGFLAYTDGVNVGLENKENGYLSLATNASEKMRITSGGNVGIGTTNPGAKLEISHGGINNGLLLENTLNSSNYQIALNIRENEGLIFQRWIAGAFNGNLMRIGYTGAIKFDAYNSTNNTGTPTYLLGTDASGNIVKTNTVPGSAAGPYLPLAGGTMTGTNGVVFPDSFELKLGTGNDAQIKHNGGHLFIDNSVGNSYLRNTSTGSILLRNSTGGDIQFDNEFAGNILFNTSNIERMRVDSSGNVGIGVVPEAWTVFKTLQIGQASSFVGRISSNQTDVATNWYYDGAEKRIASGYAQRYTQTADGEHQFFTAGTDSADSAITFSQKLTIKNNGNVGIGTTTPNKKLHVKDTQYQLQLAGDNNYWNIGAGWTSYYDGSFLIGNNTGDKFFINSSGKVGIGTTSPASKLHVAGGIQMANDTATASAAKVGTMRYRTGTEYVEVTGTEILPNPGFDTDTNWVKGTGWTIANGKASVDNASSTALSQPSFGVTTGKIYNVRIDVSNYTSGSLQVQFGPSQVIASIGANGEYNYTVTSTITGGIFYLYGVGDCEFSVDNASVIEVEAEDASYADMCMQTGSSTYEWVNIVRNTY